MEADDLSLSEPQYWEREATRLRRTGLKEIRSTAGMWQATIGTLLGILGLVAFVEGPNKLGDLDGSTQAVLIAAVASVALLALFAVVLAAIAAQGVPRRFRVLTGKALARQNAESADRAVQYLAWSRGLAIAATAILIFGTIAAWSVGLSGDDGGADDAVRAIVVTNDGTVHCGVVQDQGTQGLALVDSKSEPLLRLVGAVAQVQIVPDCPKPK